MMDRGAGPSGLVVISLQKLDSLIFFGCNRKLKRFLQYNAGGIWTKIHMNPNMDDWLNISIESYIGLYHYPKTGLFFLQEISHEEGHKFKT